MVRPESFRPRFVQLFLGLKVPVDIFLAFFLLVGREPLLLLHTGILASGLLPN